MPRHRPQARLDRAHLLALILEFRRRRQFNRDQETKANAGGNDRAAMWAHGAAYAYGTAAREVLRVIAAQRVDEQFQRALQRHSRVRRAIGLEP